MSAGACAALIFALAAPLVAPVPTAYADADFVASLESGLHAFYRRDFGPAEAAFALAVERRPANTFAIAFLDAAAAHQPGALDALVAAAEAAASRGRSADAHVQLGFAYAFAGSRYATDASEQFLAAERIAPNDAGVHDGLGILRQNARNANRAKLEFQAALQRDPDDVLAREYLALLYQVDLKDPVRALAYAIEIPNLVPGYADIDFHIASLLEDLHQPDAAIMYASRGLELDIGHVGEAGRHGFTLLARLYIARKQVADARRVLRAAMLADTDREYAQTLLQRIDAGETK